MDEAAQKLERRVAKVERKRALLQLACTAQVLGGLPFTVFVSLTNGHTRSLLGGCTSAVGVLWVLSGALGVSAFTTRRVQQLTAFIAVEIFVTLLTAAASSVLLLLYHVQCWEAAPRGLPASAQGGEDDEARAPWARCPNVLLVFGGATAMLFYSALTAMGALSLRGRIQKVGKRNLNWNQKPQLLKERHLRRGASAALKALGGGKVRPP